MVYAKTSVKTKWLLLLSILTLISVLNFSWVSQGSGISSISTTLSELKFVIEKNEKQDKIVGLTTLADTTKVRISSSDLLDKETGDILPGSNINFNNTDSLNITLIKFKQSNIAISIVSNSSGTYYGNILFLELDKNNVTKLPIIVTVDDDLPNMWLIAIVLFVGGFITSLGFHAWRSSQIVAKKFDSLREELTEIWVENGIYGVYIDGFESYLPIIDLWMYESLEIMDWSNVDKAEVKVNQLKATHNAMMDKQNFNVERLTDSSKLLGYDDVKEYVRILTRASIDLKIAKRKSARDFSDLDPALTNIEFSYGDYLNNPGRLRSIFLFNITSIILGLIIALGSMMQQDYFKDLNEMNLISGTIFFALGAATDNIKQVIEKLIGYKLVE